MTGATWPLLLRLRLESLGYVLFRLPNRYKVRYFVDKLTAFSKRRARREARLAMQQKIEQEERLMPDVVLTVKRAMQRAIKGYVVKPYNGPVTYLRARDDDVYIPFFRAWETLNQSCGEIIDIPGTHWTVMSRPLIESTAAHVQRWLDER